MQHISSAGEELGRACFLGRDGHCSNKKDLHEEGFLRLFMSSQKHRLPRPSARHIALPVEPEGLAKVMDPVSISSGENSLQTEQSVAPVTQPTRLIGRWLLLVC